MPEFDPTERRPFYAPPDESTIVAEVVEPPRFRIVAVIVGMLVDIVASAMVGFAMGFLFGAIHMGPRVTPEEIARLFAQRSRHRSR